MATVPRVAVPPRDPVPFVLSSVNLSGRYVPTRGIPGAFLVHGLVLFVSLVFSGVDGFLGTELPPDVYPVDNRLEVRMIRLLPPVGGGSRGGGGRMEAPQRVRSSAPAARREGLVYPGPQPIQSDTREATNRAQTVLQPTVRDLPVLKPPQPLPLPNLVQLADASRVPPDFAAPRPVVRPPEPVRPAPSQPPPPPVEAPPVPQPPVELPPPQPPEAISLRDTAVVMSVPLPLPRAEIQPAVVELLPETRELVPPPPPPPEPEPVTEPEPAPVRTLAEVRPVEFSSLPVRGTDRRNLLSLSPDPSRPEESVEIPQGEIHGQFRISPEGTVIDLAALPGSTPGEGNPTVVNIGFGRGQNSGEGVYQLGQWDGAGGPGSGSGRGSGIGSGIGVGSGPGSGSGSGTGIGPGSGAGTGPGSGPFGGVSIVGGADGTGSVSRPGPATRPLRPAQISRPQHRSYGLFVVSTEDSGGGLPSYGVFTDQHIFTVYLDMKESATDPAPWWTFQFALLDERNAQLNTEEDLEEALKGLVLPFPTTKPRPELPSELVQWHQQKMVVVYAVIGVEGRMEELTIKESPDSRFNRPVLDALSRWLYQPAKMDGEAVAVKVLIGIPLSLDE